MAVSRLRDGGGATILTRGGTNGDDAPRVYDALRDAQGVSEEKARKAAEAIAAYENRFADLAARSDPLEGRINTLTWMVGANITLTLLVLGKLFPVHS
jgi:hypothetical protein